MKKNKEFASAYEKIYYNSALKKIKGIGDYNPLSPSLILGHDPLIAILIDDFEKNGFSFDKNVIDKCFFTADHFAPPASAERAGILKKFLDFSYERGVKNVKVFEGICHQLVVEHEGVDPFSFIIGTDSHTCTAGALCCLASGYGSMDVLYALVKGHILERKFPAVRINFKGSPARHIDGRDIFLLIVKAIGEGMANKKVIEYFDGTRNKLCMDDRFSISCATVETGASSGIFEADSVLAEYLSASRKKKKSRAFYEKEFEDFYSDVIFKYESEITFDLGGLKSMIAHPHGFCVVNEAGGLSKSVKIDQAFIGSCASGRLSDFRRMCETIDRIRSKSGKKLARRNFRTRLIVTPASQKIYLEAIEAGYIQKLIGFGAVITNPSCGPCGGIDKGIIAEGETCVTTATRNFQGRMGPKDSLVYISSAPAAIYSSFAGEIADPGELYAL